MAYKTLKGRIEQIEKRVAVLEENQQQVVKEVREYIEDTEQMANKIHEELREFPNILKNVLMDSSKSSQEDGCKIKFPSHIDFTDKITYDEARAYVQAHSQDISLEDKEKIEELIHFIQVTTQNGIGFAKGCLYRYSDLLNRYKWLYKLTEKLLLQYWT